MSTEDEQPWNRNHPPEEDEPHTPRDVIGAARKRVKAPAIALMIVGVINSCLALFVVVMGFIVGGMNMGPAEGAIGIVNGLAGIAIFTGGLNLLKLDNYSLVRTGSITAMVPCISLCLIFGLPIGIWALVTAGSPDVQVAFRRLKQKKDNDW